MWRHGQRRWFADVGQLSHACVGGEEVLTRMGSWVLTKRTRRWSLRAGVTRIADVSEGRWTTMAWATWEAEGGAGEEGGYRADRSSMSSQTWGVMWRVALRTELVAMRHHGRDACVGDARAVRAEVMQACSCSEDGGWEVALLWDSCSRCGGCC